MAVAVGTSLSHEATENGRGFVSSIAVIHPTSIVSTHTLTEETMEIRAVTEDDLPQLLTLYQQYNSNDLPPSLKQQSRQHGTAVAIKSCC